MPMISMMMIFLIRKTQQISLHQDLRQTLMKRFLLSNRRRLIFLRKILMCLSLIISHRKNLSHISSKTRRRMFPKTKQTFFQEKTCQMLKLQRLKQLMRQPIRQDQSRPSVLPICSSMLWKRVRIFLT